MTVEFTDDDASELDLLHSAQHRHEPVIRAAIYDLTRKICAAEHLVLAFNTAVRDKFKVPTNQLDILEVALADDDLIVTISYGMLPLDEVTHMLFHFTDCHSDSGLFENIYFCDAWINPHEDNAQFVVHHHRDNIRSANCRMIMELS